MSLSAFFHASRVAKPIQAHPGMSPDRANSGALRCDACGRFESHYVAGHYGEPAYFTCTAFHHGAK